MDQQADTEKAVEAFENSSICLTILSLLGFILHYNQRI